MANEKYNGWTNYATWRVNLEIFDGMGPRDVTGRTLPAVSELREALQEYAEEIIDSSAFDGLAKDYVLAFLADVNWYEITNHMLADEDEDETDEETETEGE